MYSDEVPQEKKVSPEGEQGRGFCMLSFTLWDDSEIRGDQEVK